MERISSRYFFDSSLLMRLLCILFCIPNLFCNIDRIGFFLFSFWTIFSFDISLSILAQLTNIFFIAIAHLNAPPPNNVQKDIFFVSIKTACYARNIVSNQSVLRILEHAIFRIIMEPGQFEDIVMRIFSRHC